MSNFFEQELRKLFDEGKIIDNPAWSGRVCFGMLGEDLRVRAQFISTYISGEYDALKLTVLNRTDGPVDTLVLKLEDVLGKKPIPGNSNFREGIGPRIWDDYGKLEWYAYPPQMPTMKQSGRQWGNI